MSDDETKISALYRELGPAVYRRCLRLLGDKEQAKDATQEVFLKLTRDIQSLEGRASALPWVYRTALHHCLNLRRDHERRKQREAVLTVREDVTELGYDEAQLSQKLLSRFDATTQAVAVGVLVDGLEHELLAQSLRISRKTVSRKLHRFLENARKYLARSDA